jgi:hypothetical protein
MGVPLGETLCCGVYVFAFGIVAPGVVDGVAGVVVEGVVFGVAGAAVDGAVLDEDEPLVVCAHAAPAPSANTSIALAAIRPESVFMAFSFR